MYNPRKEFMLSAIEVALESRKKGDYAIGAVIVKDGKIIARGGNRIKLDENPLNHAEIVVIDFAAKLLKSRFLTGCILYTTYEPCPMCAAAAIWARMEGIVFGSRMEDMAKFSIGNANAKFSWRTIPISSEFVIEKGTPALFLVKDFMREECKKLFHS